jgi:hypothetical protein
VWRKHHKALPGFASRWHNLKENGIPSASQEAPFLWYCNDGAGHPALKVRRGGAWQGVAGHGAVEEKGRTCALSLWAVLFDRPIDFLS